MHYNFEQFTSLIRNEMLRLRPEFSTRSFTTNKNGELLTTLVYDKHPDNDSDVVIGASPCVYIEPLYEEYLNGASLYNIIEKVSDIASATPPEIDFDLDYENDIRNRLLIRVQNYDKMRPSLDDIPHTRFEDLVITYHIFMHAANNSGFYVATVNESLLNQLGIDREQLHEDALRNSAIHFPANLISLNDLVLENYIEFLESNNTSEEEIEESIALMKEHHNDMFILTNKQCLKGAAAIFYKGELKRIAELLEAKELLILPSSVDEVIIVPDAIDYAPHYRRVVKDVNFKEVPERDVLSNNVYGFNPKKDELYLIAN